jgi:LmbE family N-acetylglucosaminyl deacetylase
MDRPDMVARIEETLHREMPRQVLIPSPSYHQDHKAMYEAGLAATRPMSQRGYLAARVATYEYPGSAWRHDGSESQLNWYIDIGSVLERKLAAIEHYTSSQHGRAMVDPDVVRSWARLRGQFVGVEYAEAFTLLRLVESAQPALR